MIAITEPRFNVHGFARRFRMYGAGPVFALTMHFTPATPLYPSGTADRNNEVRF